MDERGGAIVRRALDQPGNFVAPITWHHGRYRALIRAQLPYCNRVRQYERQRCMTELWHAVKLRLEGEIKAPQTMPSSLRWDVRMLRRANALTHRASKTERAVRRTHRVQPQTRMRGHETQPSEARRIAQLWYLRMNHTAGSTLAKMSHVPRPLGLSPIL